MKRQKHKYTKQESIILKQLKFVLNIVIIICLLVGGTSVYIKKRKELNQNIFETNKKIEILSSENYEIKVQNENLKSETEKLNEENTNLNQEITEIKSQNEALQNEKLDLTEKNKELESQNTKYKEQIFNQKTVSSRSSNSLTESQYNSDTTFYNSNDLDLMARIIYAEAGNCSDEEQLLVGNVIMNRVADKDYPNNIHDVIYQKGQYSPTWNGAINKTPSSQAIKNAKRILNGERFCPSNVIYQAMFKQGSGVYKSLKNPDGTTYFCYK